MGFEIVKGKIMQNNEVSIDSIKMRRDMMLTQIDVLNKQLEGAQAELTYLNSFLDSEDVKSLKA